MYVQWLKDNIAQNTWGKKPFMIWRDQDYDYDWLLGQADAFETTIKTNTIGPGRVCAIAGDYSPYSAALLLALIANRNIIVPISTVVEDRRNYYCDVSQAEFIFEFNAKDEFIIKRTGSSITNPLLKKLQKSGSSGLVLFTSGSTGNPKAALYDFDRLLKNYCTIKKTMRSLVFLQLDHIGGINTMFSLISSGGTMVVLDERNPLSVCRLIEKHKIELFPTTPSFLNLLRVSEAYKEYDLSSLKLITYGTEVMPESLLKALIQIFPGVNFKQTYGLTEVGILRSKSQSNDSLWVKVGGENYQTKVVDGILWIKSDTPILGYLNAPDPFTEDGWLVTKDRVEVDGEFIKILGRTEEIINVGGLKVYPTEVEDVILQMENVSDVMVFGERNPMLGNIVCSKVMLKDQEELGDFRKRLYQFCMNKLERYKIPQKIEITGDHLVGNERFKKIRKEETGHFQK
jgi:long-chain acyl-CoA synthetase